MTTLICHKGICICLALFLSSFVGISQDFGGDTASRGLEQTDENKTPLKDRFYFGGNVGAQFGSQTFVMVSPLVGFKITDRWSVGTRATYQYIQVKYGTFNYQNHVFGGSAFTRYFIIKDFFGHVEYEVLNGDWSDSGNRSNIPALFVGGGYLFRIGENAGFGLSILFNLLPSALSPYSNPIINAGFTVGL